MTYNEFDEKYKNYLEDGHYGLAIHNEEVIDCLDKIFQDLIKYPNFQYSQIKEKWGMARCYTNIPGKLGRIIENGIEEEINEIFKKIEKSRNPN